MRPFVSFVFPVAPTPTALELLHRSVGALRQQTVGPAEFEVVIALDGGPSADVDVGAQPFDVRVVPSARTAGHEHLPHRNHARNAACRAARGAYLWVLDADMIAAPCAVEHLHALVERQRVGRPGVPIVASPCFAEPAMTPEEWMRVDTRGPGLVEAKLALHARAHGLEPPHGRPLPLRKKTASGQHHRHRPGAPTSLRYPQLVEGFPALPRWLFQAMEGFDERFLGWGGNKIEFCRRLRFLDVQEDIVEVHLLTSVLFLHQPHERDPLHFDEALRAKNTALFDGVQAGAEQRAPWWCAQVEAVRRAIEGHTR